MIAEWIADGAAFGIKAFFAVVVFILCCGVTLGLLAVIAMVFGGDDDGTEDKGGWAN